MGGGAPGGGGPAMPDRSGGSCSGGRGIKAMRDFSFSAGLSMRALAFAPRMNVCSVQLSVGIQRPRKQINVPLGSCGRYSLTSPYVTIADPKTRGPFYPSLL